MPRFIDHLHAFRGLAIVAIVGAHVWSFTIFWTGGLNAPGLAYLFAATETLFHGSTLYFALISGLLFTQVLQGRSWRQFLSGKFKHVLLPYMAMSLLMTLLFWDYTLSQDPDAQFWFTFGWSLIAGKASIHLWYMPVLFFLFAVTPLLAGCAARPGGRVLLAMVIVAPLIISRTPFPDFVQWPTFVYFTGAYALGIVVGGQYERVMTWVAPSVGWLLGLVLITSVFIFWGYSHDAVNYGVFNLRQSLVYVQKLAAALIALHYLARYETRLPRALRVLGDYAFAVYFLHVIAIGYLINAGLEWLQAERTIVNLALFGLLNLFVAIAASIAIAWLVKRCLGRHSRKLVGA